MHPETKVSITPTICTTSALGQHILKLVWQNDVVGLLYVLGVVGTTQVCVMMGRQVSTSAVNKVNSWNIVLRISRVVEIAAMEKNLQQLLHNKGLHLKDLLTVLVRDKITSIQSRVSNNKRISTCCHRYDKSLTCDFYALLEPGESLFF